MSLKIIPLGGLGNVTQNMYLYESDQEILIVDCGIGFPTQAMPGIDVMIPDITYLKEQLNAGKKIVGMLLTHGHDDHIAATPYILPQLPEFPIYASSLTAGFATERLLDGGVERNITVIKDREAFRVGSEFEVVGFPITHSVPDTRHFAIKTSVGLIYHGTDFKVDLEPVDGVQCDFEAIAHVASEGVLCMLIDCLRVERQMWSKTESSVSMAIEESMFDVKGKYIVTLMSSHIHRIQQVANMALQFGRKLVFIGRSVEKNVEVALRLHKLNIPRDAIIDKRDMGNYKDEQLCVVVAGSQGQEGSSLMRAVYGDHPMLTIQEKDRVVFSSDAIPGNEIPYYGAIDELSRNQVRVLYPDVMPNLHQSGHGGAMEQQLLISLVKPKYVMPIGGQDRHREKFHELVAEKLGYRDEHILVPASGDVIEFDYAGGGDGGVQSDAQSGMQSGTRGRTHSEIRNEGSTALRNEIRPRISDHIAISSPLVDGLGIGDVGRSVLADRVALGREGMIVLVIPKIAGRLDVGKMSVVSRGFVFMKEAQEVIQFIKTSTAEILDEMGALMGGEGEGVHGEDRGRVGERQAGGQGVGAQGEQGGKQGVGVQDEQRGRGKDGAQVKDDDLRRALERRLTRKLYKIIKRSPMVLPVFVEM